VPEGLQPFLLYDQVGGPVRPRETGERFDEQVSEPEHTAAIDRMDVAEVLEGWWWGPEVDELAADEELRAMFAPFGARFPGLAPAVEEGLDPELMRRALMQYTRRLGSPGPARSRLDRPRHSEQPILGLLVGLAG
jgi:hypothetical protein